jgi:glycosyltransferase involved in cell wall biosynthesis
MIRLAVVCDFIEENWPSMNLVAEMLFNHLQAEYSQEIKATRICPQMKRRFTRLPFGQGKAFAVNADRLLNRLRDYPKHLRRANAFDLFHVADHSYAHLVHHLPGEMTGVFCHDLDTFRCLLAPEKEPRPRWFKAIARRALSGMQKARIVFHSTRAVREEIEHHGLLDTSRLVQAPYGLSEEFSPQATTNEIEQDVTAKLNDAPFLLHVGSCIQRKRIDVLLEVFASVRAHHPELKLVQVGGEWTFTQREQIARHSLEEHIHQPRNLKRATIAELYRRAALVLLPSEAEGFGLPVIEALACGGIVVASDINVLREVGENAVVYCSTADVEAWTETVDKLLLSPELAPEREIRLSRARCFSWSEHTRIIAEAYKRLR